MGSFLSTLCTVYFGVVVVIPMIVAAVLTKLITLLPLTHAQKCGYSLMVVQAAWRLSLMLTPWIRTYAQGDFVATMRQFSRDVQLRGSKEEGARPVMLLGNHTSFLDTLLTVATLSAGSAYYSRTYMSAHLFKLPVLSTICRACGHFSVDFKGSGDTDFRVDKEKMEKTQQRVDEHIENGGLLCFFPEGAMNKDPTQIMPVRYGGMKKALQFDAKVYVFVTNGCHAVWPRKAQISGRPGVANYTIHCVAPEGARALAGKLRQQPGNEKKEDYEVLSLHVREVMQGCWDNILDGSSSSVKKKN
jgi:1-acyl-sn-glycerol-3-phosphate acyltransferase